MPTLRCLLLLNLAVWLPAAMLSAQTVGALSPSSISVDPSMVAGFNPIELPPPPLCDSLEDPMLGAAAQAWLDQISVMGADPNLDPVRRDNATYRMAYRTLYSWYDFAGDQSLREHCTSTNTDPAPMRSGRALVRRADRKAGIPSTQHSSSGRHCVSYGDGSYLVCCTFDSYIGNSYWGTQVSEYYERLPPDTRRIIGNHLSAIQWEQELPTNFLVGLHGRPPGDPTLPGSLMASQDSITPASGPPASDPTFIYPVGQLVPNWSSAFLEEAGRQLLEKAPAQTGLSWFQEAGLFCLVGVSDPAIRVEETPLGYQASAIISVITPSSFSFDVRIGWRATTAGASQEDVLDLATNMESPSDVIVDWLEPLPLEAMMPHLKPRKKRKMVVERGDSRDTISIHDMPWSFPDMELRFHLNHVPAAAEQVRLANACRNFAAATAYAYPAPWFVSSPDFDPNKRTLTVILDTGQVTGNKDDRDRLDQLIRSICQQFATIPTLIRIL